MLNINENQQQMNSGWSNFGGKHHSNAVCQPKRRGKKK